jgi:hypothetical protein
MSSSLQCIPVIKSEYHGTYYIYDGFKYHLNFPLAWAANHEAWEKNPTILSGPKFCQDCRISGCIKEVFVSYCFNCLKFIYKGKRLTPIDGMEKVPTAIYHWQMGTTAINYGLDKQVITESGIIPPPPSPLTDADAGVIEIDLAADFDDFDVLDAIYYENKTVLK